MIFSKISLILAALAAPALAGECKTMTVFRDRRDMDDDTLKAFKAVYSNNPDKPGETYGLSLPLYSKKDREGKVIGTLEETWITTDNGEAIGSIGLNIEGEGQIVSHWSENCNWPSWEVPVVGGTGDYRGIQGYILGSEAGDYSKDKDFVNKLKIYYDC